MKFVIDLLKSVNTGTKSKSAKGASKPTKSKSTASKGTRSAEMTKKYPGGEWVTMHGRHVYIKEDGNPAKETIPAGMKAAEVKATHAQMKQAQAKAAQPAKKTRVKQTAAMKLGQKEAKAEKIQLENLEARKKQHRAENKELRKNAAKEKMQAPTLVREQTHDGSKPAKAISQKVIPDAKNIFDYDEQQKAAQKSAKNSADRAAAHLENAGPSLNRELEKKGKAQIPGVKETQDERQVNNSWDDRELGSFPVAQSDRDPMTGEQNYVWKKGATLDEIARSHQGLLMNAVTKKMANRYGLQALQRENAWFDKNGKPADLFGDVHQEANLGFIHGVQEYLKDPQALKDRGVSPLAHAVGRAHDNVKRRMQRILNDVPLPQKFLTPMAVFSKARNTVLSDEKRSDMRGDALRDAIKAQLEADGNLGIIHNLAFEDSRKGEVHDLNQKLDLLEGVKRLQRANTRLDKTTDGGDGGDKEQSLHEKVGTTEDKDARVVAQERDKELHGALKKFLGEHLTDREADVVAMKHGVSLKKYLGSDEDHEFKEIAEKTGLKISNAKKVYYSAMKKLKAAPADKLESLRKMLMDKSLVMDLMKSLYLMDLEEFMMDSGMSLKHLQPVFAGRAYGETYDEIEKSLSVGQFIGSYVTVDAGVRANIISYELPGDDILIKSFNDNLIKSQSDPNGAVRGWAQGNAGKVSAMSKQQHAHIGKKSGGLTWSEQLQADHPGSAWVTWHGERILMGGNGNAIYNSSVQEHREKYHPGESNPIYHHEALPGHEDQGVAAQRDGFENLKNKWHGAGANARGEKHALSADVNNWGHYLKTTGGVHFDKDVHGGMDDKAITNIFGAENVKSAKLNAMKKMAPGHYELTNPETGKKVVIHLDWKDNNRGKDGAPTEGKAAHSLELKRAYDPEADVTKRDNKDLQSNRGFLRYMGYNLEPEKGDKEGLAKGDYHFSLSDVKDALGGTLRNQANTNFDKNKKGTKLQLKQISAEDFEGQHGKATSALRDNMAYKLQNIKDVTPKSLKTVKGERDYPGKVFEVPMANGTTHRFDIDEQGGFSDPIMQKLIDPAFAIHNSNDLYTALSAAVNNEKWITLSNNEWTHGQGLHHHVKLRFDGKGAPVVVGGSFDGKRLQDSAETPNAEDKEASLFKNGKLSGGKLQMTKDEAVPMEEGNTVRYRDGKNWKEGKIQKVYAGGGLRIRKENGDTEFFTGDDKNRVRPAKTGKQVAAGGMPTVHMGKDGELSIVAPENEDMRNQLTGLGVELDDKGRAPVSINQLERLREQIGGFSMDDPAREHLDEYFRKATQDAPDKDVSELWDKYNPANIDGWRKDSFLHPSDGKATSANFSSSQVEGMDHLLNVKKGLAGHGMGTGKTVLGVGAAAYTRDQALKASGYHDLQKQIAGAKDPKVKSKLQEELKSKHPGHTLVVAPGGIVPEWIKEIEGHTSLGHVVVGAKSAHGSMMPYKTEGNGKSEEHETKQIGYDQFKPKKHADKHFHVMSRDTFMAMRDSMGEQKFNKWLKDSNYKNAIFDEVHAYKTKGGARNAALKSVAPHVDNVWGMSGTAMDNNVPDIHHLIDAVTGGVHNLGSEKEFNAQYMEKANGKIVGMNGKNLPELGQKLAKYAHFRDGKDVNIINNGHISKLSFPEVRGGGNHYQGEVHHIMDSEPQTVSVKGGAEGETREVNVPKLKNPDATGAVTPKMTTAKTADGKTVNVMHIDHKDGDLNSHIMARYKQLESSLLSENQRQGLADAERSGETGEGSQNFLPAVQHLQQFLNAPLSEHAYYSKAGANDNGTGGTKQYEHVLDADGNRLYRAKNANGTAMSDAKGNPVYLPPMHQYNPKALALKTHIENLLDNWKSEMDSRRKYNQSHVLTPNDPQYRPMYPPKIAITSQYNDFGKEVIKNVLRDIQKNRGGLGLPLTTGEFSGDNQGERDKEKLNFNSKHTMKDPGHTFMAFSDAGKEGLDLGNAHDLIHYDHDFNAQESAQKSAREIRASSYKHAEREKRANVVGLHTIAVPGTMEDSILRMQHRKMTNIAQVEGAVKKAESGGTKSDYLEYRAGAARNFGRNTERLEKQRAKKSPVLQKSLVPATLEGKHIHVIRIK